MKVHDTPKCYSCGKRGVVKDPWGAYCPKCWLEKYGKEKRGKR